MEKNPQSGSASPAYFPPSFEELAVQQNVATLADLEQMMGHPSAEDESPEDFAAMLRTWRHEGTISASDECRDR